MGFGKGRGRREGLLALLFAVVGGVLLRGGREESGGVLLADPGATSPATAHDGARDPETSGSRETLPGSARPLQLGAVAGPAVTLEKTEVQAGDPVDYFIEPQSYIDSLHVGDVVHLMVYDGGYAHSDQFDLSSSGAVRLVSANRVSYLWWELTIVCVDQGYGFYSLGLITFRRNGRLLVFSGPRTRGSPTRTRTMDPGNASPPPNASAQADSRCAGAVYLHNGEEHVEETDLFVRGRGAIDFNMTRHYRSRLQDLGTTALGPGWGFDYDERLVVAAGTGNCVRVDGQGRADLYTRNADGTFQSPSEFFSVLRRLDVSSERTYCLRERNGFKHWFNNLGALTAHEDSNGNALRFTYQNGLLATAIDPFGRVYTFGWTANRLASVTDFSGRSVIYTHDDEGDLVAVTAPAVTGTSTGNDFPAGRTTRYTYSSGSTDLDLNHNLLTVTDPVEVAAGGGPRLQIAYGTNPADPLTYDKVISVVKGGTNASGVPAGGTWVVTYETITDPAARGLPGDVVRLTTVTEPGGNAIQEGVDGAGRRRVRRQPTRGLRANEPAYFQTVTDYNSDSLPVRETRALGDQTELAYDTANPNPAARGDLIERREIPDATRGGGEPIVTRLSYEPLLGRVASITDPRELATSFVPSIGTVTSGRYTRRFFFDYQEGTAAIPDATRFGIDLSGVARGLGDLNGDGRTDQVNGNLVLDRAPSVTLLAGSNEALARGTTTQVIGNRSALQ